MKRLQTIGLMLLALLALGAFAASTASATEGLLPNQAGKAATGKGGGGTLETAGAKIACTSLEILNVLFLPANLPDTDWHGTADLHFKGCKAGGVFPINSLGDKSELILVKILFEICLTASATLLFGLYTLVLGEKESEDGGPLHLEIPSLAALIRVTGSVIAENLSGLKGDGGAGKVFKFQFKGKEGKQEFPTTCVIEGKELKTTLASELNEGGKVEAASENTTAEIEFTNAVELMDT